jgi:hypothetical protein
MQLALNVNRDKHATVWIHDFKRGEKIVINEDCDGKGFNVKIGTITVYVICEEDAA